jgi:hypothetical protein
LSCGKASPPSVVNRCCWNTKEETAPAVTAYAAGWPLESGVAGAAR